jgi:hypothetical protein
MRRVSLGISLVLYFWALGENASGAQPGHTWESGDLFLGVGFGQYQVRDQAGALKEILSTGRSGFTTGCTFDAGQQLYVTETYEGIVSRFAGPAPPHTNTVFGSSFIFPNNVVFGFDGKVCVSDATYGILQFAPDGTYLKTVISTRVDSFDIAADNDTILYTQQGPDIKTVSIASGLPGPNFSTGTAIKAVNIRILPDGGALLTNLSLSGSGGDVKRYNAAGVVVATYDVSAETEHWFSLALDPDGISFWAGNSGSSNYYKFNLATPGIDSHIAGPFNTGTGPSTLFGMCVFRGSATGGPPTSKEQCMDGGWQSFTNPEFKNQGDCIKFVNTGK